MARSRRRSARQARSAGEAFGDLVLQTAVGVGEALELFDGQRFAGVGARRRACCRVSMKAASTGASRSGSRQRYGRRGCARRIIVENACPLINAPAPRVSRAIGPSARAPSAPRGRSGSARLTPRRLARGARSGRACLAVERARHRRRAPPCGAAPPAAASTPIRPAAKATTSWGGAGSSSATLKMPSASCRIAATSAAARSST